MQYSLIHYSLLRQGQGVIMANEGTSLTIGKVCRVQYLTVFRLIWLFGVKNWSRAQDVKVSIMRALSRVKTSLWPQQKLGSRSQAYSEGAKLMLTSDQARDCPFQKRWSTSGILNKSTLWEIFTCTGFYVENARVFLSQLTIFWTV